MHIPDGFINVPTSAGFGAAAAGGLWFSLRRTAAILDDRRIPLAGLAAAFIFAAQMINFPVASGTSGHLIGAVLATVLLGPWLGSVVLTVVLVVQGIFFADGGLSAIGLNVFNMALIATFLGYGMFALFLRVLPPRMGSVVVGAGIAAGLSVLLAAAGFSLQYWIGGEGGVDAGRVTAAMLGVHSLIGIGEGIITAFVVGAVVRVRPDLVAGTARPSTEPVDG